MMKLDWLQRAVGIRLVMFFVANLLIGFVPQPSRVVEMTLAAFLGGVCAIAYTIAVRNLVIDEFTLDSGKAIMFFSLFGIIGFLGFSTGNIADVTRRMSDDVASQQVVYETLFHLVWLLVSMGIGYEAFIRPIFRQK